MTPFERSVFVYCPFDRQYLDILRPLVFTVLYLGLEPRLSLHDSNSGEPRIVKIRRAIEQSKYAIHDISRCRAIRKGEMFRLNMPLELGLDIGCRFFKGGRWRRKCCLILETSPYRYQAALSDLSNSDIFAHRDRPEDAVKGVRNWLVQEANAPAHSGSKIWVRFNEFTSADFEQRQSDGFSRSEIDALPIVELMRSMKNWIRSNRNDV